MGFTRRAERRGSGTEHTIDHGVIFSHSVDDGQARLRVQSQFGNMHTVIVPQVTAGDHSLPQEGERIYFARTRDDKGIWLGTVADDGDGKERTVTHPYSDTSVTMHEDGSTTITGESDVTVESGGDVTLNADGDIYLNGINFEEHTHDYSWTDSAGSGTTDEPA